MKIVVFGGSGFLGSHVADALTLDGHDVTIFDLKPSLYLQANQKMTVGDVLDFDLVKKATKGANAVYNFCGVADINEAKKERLKSINANVLGTTHILEACLFNKVNRFMFASTVYVYSEAGSFYRASKQACELIIESYQKQCGLDFTILRYGSLYGPRANKTNWIYQIVNQALTEGKITRHGDGDEIREYIHVYDAAKLSAKALAPEFKNEYVIISGHQPIQIRNLMIMIKEILNNKVELEFTNQSYEEHYEITPYNFRPRLAKRITDSSYVDLGQGILHVLTELHDQKKQVIGKLNSLESLASDEVNQ